MCNTYAPAPYVPHTPPPPHHTASPGQHQAVTPAAHTGTLLASPALIQLSGRDTSAAATAANDPASTQRPPLQPRTTPQSHTAGNAHAGASPAPPASMKKVVTMATTPQPPAVTPASVVHHVGARHTPMSLRMAAATPLASGRMIPQHITFQDFLKVCVGLVEGVGVGERCF